MFVFEWEGFGLESFWNDTSPHTHMYIKLNVLVAYWWNDMFVRMQIYPCVGNIWTVNDNFAHS